MILTYHGIDSSGDENSVTRFNFLKQILFLKINRFKIVSINDYDKNNKHHIVLRFDDGLKSVLKAAKFLRFFNAPFSVFIVYDFYKEQNSPYLNKDDCLKLLTYKANLQYHSKTHLDLSKTSDEKILEDEIICPKELKDLDSSGFKFFAYPFWRFNEKALNIVSKYYEGGVSGNGFANNSKYALDSLKVTNKTRLKDFLMN